MKIARQSVAFMMLHGDLMTVINTAVCTYPHFVSDDFAETPYISWKAAVCTYPYFLKKLGASQHGSHSQ
jgi:hypothetical protein